MYIKVMPNKCLSNDESSDICSMAYCKIVNAFNSCHSFNMGGLYSPRTLRNMTFRTVPCVILQVEHGLQYKYIVTLTCVSDVGTFCVFYHVKKYP